LEDIAATRDIYQVIQAGKVVDREGLAAWTDTIPRPEEWRPEISIPGR